MSHSASETLDMTGLALACDSLLVNGVELGTSDMTTWAAFAADVDATAVEINRMADVSARLVAAGASLTLTAASHSDRVVALDTAAGSTITLPAATGTGMRFKFVVTVKPTSNQHRIDVVGSDAFFGSVNILDADSTAQAAYAAGTDADRFDMNGTTKGGQVGDTVELIDMVSGKWQISGQLVCPAGSNIASPFTTGAVT